MCVSSRTDIQLNQLFDNESRVGMHNVVIVAEMARRERR